MPSTMASLEALNKELFKNLYAYDVNKVRDLLRKGAIVNARDKNGWTPLLECAISGNSHMVREFLICEKLDVNVIDYCGMTTLMLAIKFGHSGIAVELLNDERVDVNAKNDEGLTALMVAIDLDKG